MSEDNLRELKEKITPVFKRYGVEYASVFGSVARGEDGPNSDVDLVVRVQNLPFGIWGFVGLKQDLEQVLNKKVDIISETAINDRLAQKIRGDLTPIYAQ